MQTIYATHNESLTGRNAQSRKIANNTYLVRRGADIAVKLHNTDVVTFHPDNTATLSTGGWYSVTTKDRINDALRGTPVRVWQERGKWYVHANGDKVPFANGVRVDLDSGEVVGDKPTTDAADASNKRLEKLLRAYCEALTPENIKAALADTGGDCWYCLMRTVDTDQALGDKTGNTDHLWSHLEEGYIVGTLIANAYQARGYGDWRFVLAMDTQGRQVSVDRVRENVRKYFRARLREGAMTTSGFARMGTSLSAVWNS